MGLTMLNKSAIDSAYSLMEVADARSMIIVPLEISPLKELVMAARADEKFVVINGENIAPNVDDMLYIANTVNPGFGTSDHDKTMDEITAVAAKSVQGQISFARTVVAPVVSELVHKVSESIGGMSASELLGMEVIVKDEPAPLLNPAIKRMVEDFESLAYQNPALRMRLPSMAVSDVIENMMTGNNVLDNDIRQWAAAIGIDFFISVWETFFQQKQADLTDTKIVTFRDLLNDAELGKDRALAVFLLARRLIDDVPNGTEMAASDYENLMADFRNNAGNVVAYHLSKMERTEKTALLVLSYTDNTVTVDGPNYKRFIEAGGSNEVLFGSLVKGPMLTSNLALLEKAAELKAVWDHHCSLVQSVERNRRYNRIKEFLAMHFQLQLKEITQEELGTIGNIDKVLNKFNEMLQYVTESELVDLYALCLKLVCYARFPNSGAERILTGIENAKKANPEIEIREAAAIAILEYIADWVATQMVVKVVA